MAHIHEVKDTDLCFMIDPVTRQITPQDESKDTVIQYDHNSEVLSFSIPRIVDGHDMDTCNKIEVHFLNVGETETNKGVYIVEEKEVKNDALIVCWKIAQTATMLKGKIGFLIRFMCVNGRSIDYVWNTAIYSGLKVAEGLDNGEYIVENYVDVLETWKQEIVADLGERVTTDWNESNVNSPAYIQNRTHYDGQVIEEVLPTTTIPFRDNSTEQYIFCTFPIIVGNTYVVNYNGIDYTLEAIADHRGEWVLGRYSAYNMDCPFSVLFVNDEIVGHVAIIETYDGAKDVTLSIHHLKNGVKQLDNKYIKDMYGTTYDIVEVLPETILNGATVHLSNAIDIKTGDTCFVSINNVVSVHTAYESIDNVVLQVPRKETGNILIGSGKHNYINGGLDGDKISITKKVENVVPVPTKYLPKPIVFTLSNDFATMICNKSFDECVEAFNNFNFSVWVASDTVRMQCHRIAFNGTTFNASFELGMNDIVISYTADNISFEITTDE